MQHLGERPDAICDLVVLVPAALTRLVAEWAVRFFYLPNVSTAWTQPGSGLLGSQLGGGMAGIAGTNDDLTCWMQSACSRVTVSRWQPVASNSGGFGAGAELALYDHAGRAHE